MQTATIELGDLEITSVGESSSLPEAISLQQNYPNPFNSSTRISFEIAREQYAEIVLYDIMGREIKVLADEIFQPGSYEVTWDGKDESGNSVASGLYFYCLKAGDSDISKRMMLIK